MITDNMEIDYSSIRLYVLPFMVFFAAAPVPGGYNVSYQHPVDFADGSVIQCRIYCKDNYGNVLDYAWEFTIDSSAEYFSLELQPGWNLISVPLETANTSAANVLSSIYGSWDSAKYYDASDRFDPWKAFRPEGQANDLASIDMTMGIWVHATETCLLKVSGLQPESTSITLLAGWNLVGYPTLDDTMTAAIALWGTGADRVEVSDPASPDLISAVGPDYAMRPGEGYWVHVPADTIWTVNW